MPNYLITGGAGFIGSHLTARLLEDDDAKVTCVDNYSNNYPREIKLRNISAFTRDERYRIVEQDISDAPGLIDQLQGFDTPDVIFHLAAMVGVRPSLQFPEEYYMTNVLGTLNILEYARTRGVRQVVFASSSSIYGQNPNMPWKVNDPDLVPISPYASSKLAAEQLGQVYANLYNLTFTALRIFTVYGSRQRPDLAIHKFIDHMTKKQPLPLYGDGSTFRDYTHVSDIVSGMLLAMSNAEPGFSCFNLGSGNPVTLLDLVKALETVTGFSAIIDFQEMQAGDVDGTFADISQAQQVLGYSPRMNLLEGLREFWSWKTSDVFSHQAVMNPTDM